MATVKSEFNLPDGNGGFNKHHLETELAQIEDIVRQPSTQYAADVIKFVAGLPTGWYLECTTPGTTDSSDITLPSPITENATVTDGTATWTIRKMGAADLSSCANTDLSNLSATGNAKLNSKANVDLDNLSAAGEAKIANIPLTSDFTIIYPNGGSKANPANVSTRSHYIEPNPFVGYHVNCVAEVFYNNKWTPTDWIWTYNEGEAGVIAFHDDASDNIIINTGQGLINTASSTVMFPNNPTRYTTPLPCRVKIWKVGKIQTT